jgi:tetratricopeptide (TPR) repeat protein
MSTQSARTSKKPFVKLSRMYSQRQLRRKQKHSQIMKTKLYLYIALFSFCIASCTQSGQNKDNTYLKNVEAIPLLLDRNEALKVDIEWSNTQSQYGRNREIAARKPHEPEAWLKLAEVFVAEARVTGEHGHYYPAALNMVNTALAIPELKKDAKFQALALKAGVLLSLHQFREALSVGQEATELNLNNAHIKGVLVDAYVELGNYPEAVKQADLMMQIRPDLRSYSRVSYLREIHGDVPGAIEALKMAISSGAPASEETAWAMLTLGNLYKEYHQPKQAREIYGHILEQRPNYPFAMAAIAHLDITQGAQAKGEAGLKQAIEIIPEVGFYVDLASLYQATGRKKEAQELIPEILKMLADDTKAGHQMGMTYAEVYGNLLNDWATARVYAHEEYTARPDNMDVNILMAKVEERMGRKNEARKYLEVAGRTKSRKPELAELLAQI